MEKVIKKTNFQTFGLECIVLFLISIGLIPTTNEIKLLIFRGNLYASIMLVVTYAIIMLRNFGIPTDPRKLIIPTAKVALVVNGLLWFVSGIQYYCQNIPASAKWLTYVFFATLAVSVVNMSIILFRKTAQE